jgi:hypothetical protein
MTAVFPIFDFLSDGHNPMGASACHRELRFAKRDFSRTPPRAAASRRTGCLKEAVTRANHAHMRHDPLLVSKRCAGFFLRNCPVEFAISAAPLLIRLFCRPRLTKGAASATTSSCDGHHKRTWPIRRTLAGYPRTSQFTRHLRCDVTCIRCAALTNVSGPLRLCTRASCRRAQVKRIAPFD